MKALITPSGNFGPFASIEVLPDRYRCDSTDLPFNVVGTGSIVDAASIVWPAPPAPPVVVPESVSMRQARLALLGAGLLAGVNAAIASLPGAQGDAARIEWEYAQEVRRDSPLIALLLPSLGLTSEQVDAMFVSAAGL